MTAEHEDMLVALVKNYGVKHVVDFLADYCDYVSDETTGTEESGVYYTAYKKLGAVSALLPSVKKGRWERDNSCR
jgi:hypothetical protein